MKHTTTLFGLVAIAISACSPPATVNDAGQDVVTQDVPPQDTGPTCIGTVPPANSPWCVMNGCPFAPVSIPSCDVPDTMYDFYNDDYCHATATLMVISAGWCVPCMQEAPQIQADITEGYADRGVRVITVYAQNPDGTTPTLAHCQGWRDGTNPRERQYSQGPLTSHMTMDQTGVTSRYTPGNAFPSNIIVDQNGNIYDVLYGSERGLTTIISDIDAVLAAEGR